VKLETSHVAQDGFVSIGRVNEVSESSMIGVTISGKPVLVSRIGGMFYAMDAVCSHLYGYLPSGELRNTTVICPVHKAQYNIVTGKVVKNVPGLMKLATNRQATDLHIYEVKVVGDSILIKV
jgi:nitrite reductase/ring-hydroxylating ferredoxin subunit